MQARDVMTPLVFSLRPHLPARAAAAVLAERGFDAAPVMDAEGRLRGVVSASDLAGGRQGAAAGEAPDQAVVADLMTPSPPTAAPGTDLVPLAASMLAAGVRCLPVLDDGRLVGVVTRPDLLRVAAAATGRPALPVVGA